MGYYKPQPETAERFSIAEAYHIVWGAGTIALVQSGADPIVKATQGKTLTGIFSRLDEISKEASVIADALPEDNPLQIHLSTLVDPITEEINDIYAEHGAETNPNFSPYSVQDERLTALHGLDIYMRISKNSLLEARRAAQQQQ